MVNRFRRTAALPRRIGGLQCGQMLRRNILVFHSGALGDFVLSWPLALALGRVYAQSRIIFITYAQKGALAERVLRLESSDVEAGWHALFAERAATLPPRAAGMLDGAHAIYTFLGPSPTWLANVNRLNPQAKVVALQPRPIEPYAAHVSQWLLDQLREHAIERAATEQILRSIADRGVGFGRPGAGRDIVIHPGSGSPAKCWPIENYIELAARLRAAGRTVRFIVGEVEQERWPATAMNALAAAGELRRPATYLDLLNELATAGTFIGNDSGPGHLAAIIGVPTVSVFGPTDPRLWQPLGPNVRVLRVEPLASLPVERVLKLVT
jgi:ADP-heptose:LPS heptosyltransferase